MGTLAPRRAWSLAFVALVAGFVGFAPAKTALAGPAQSVEEAYARLAGDAQSTVFELELTAGVTAEVFTLAEPFRVIIDLPDVTFHLAPGSGTTGQGLVKTFRYGLFAERKGRVVIDTQGPVAIREATMDRPQGGAGVVLKIAMVPVDAATFGAGTGATQGLDATGAAKSAIYEDAPAKPKGRSKPVIVIDPGHGGIDPGAMGLNNVPEKVVVLAVAQHLKAALGQSGRYEVKLSRDKDVFISLDRRLKFSHDHAADLFISLHADSIEEKNLAQNIRGATVYTLSERASDEQARLMAEKENSSDLLAGLETGDQTAKDQVKNILIDLLKRETSNFSADFAHVLVGRLAKSATLARDPQRSAAFKVLKQTHAPSVLVELGYMSNAVEAGQMITPQWQKQVAGSIAAAIDAYFAKRTAEHP
jgi:N-acetylmuramoyl-L-alanine amidase